MVNLKKLISMFVFCLMVTGAQAMDVAKAGPKPVTGTVVAQFEPRKMDDCARLLFSSLYDDDVDLFKQYLMSEGPLKERLLALYEEYDCKSLLFEAILALSPGTLRTRRTSGEQKHKIIAVILDAAQSTECLLGVLNCKSRLHFFKNGQWNLLWMTPLELAVRLNKESVVKMLARAMTVSLASISTQGPEAAPRHFGQQLMTVFPDIMDALTIAECRYDYNAETYFLTQLAMCTTLERAKQLVGVCINIY